MEDEGKKYRAYVKWTTGVVAQGPERNNLFSACADIREWITSDSCSIIWIDEVTTKRMFFAEGMPQ